MKILRSTDELAAVGGDSVSLTIGNFDGCHRGHAAVLSELVSSSSSGGRFCAAVTFEPHPISVLSPERAPRLLSPGQERLDLLSGSGVDAVAVLRFDTALASLDVRTFLRQLGAGVGSHLVLGYDFHMGRDRSCDVAMLGALGSQIGFGLDVVPPVRHGGRPVSSSRIRETLLDGAVEEAEAMLGRPYWLDGEVEEGAGVGRGLGGPTANLLLPDDKLLPADGVYVVTVRGMDDRPGLLYVGTRPTFEGRERGAEVHVFDFDGDLYGARLCVDVRRRLREDRAFVSAERLSEQIREDLKAGRRMAEAL